MWAFLLPLCSFSAGIFDRLAIPSYRNLTLAFDYGRKFIAPGQLLSFSRMSQSKNVAIRGLSVQRSFVSLITAYKKMPSSLSLYRCRFDSFLSAPVVFDADTMESMQLQTITTKYIDTPRAKTETPSEFTVDQCIFTDCVAARVRGAESDVSGGALFLRGVLADGSYQFFTAKITNTEFIRCKAGNRGGAIYAQGESVLLIRDCHFTKCESAITNVNGFGAAICYSQGTRFLVEYTKFINNIANEEAYGSVIDIANVTSVDIQHIAVIGSSFVEGINRASADIQVSGSGETWGTTYATLRDVCFLGSTPNVYNIYFSRVPDSQGKTLFRVIDCNSDKKNVEDIVGVGDDIEYVDNRNVWRLGTDYDMCPYRPTMAFTQSRHFTVTDAFTKSQALKMTAYISASDGFTLSKDHLPTGAFKGSALFTLTEEFSTSQAFSMSQSFSESLPPSVSVTEIDTESYTAPIITINDDPTDTHPPPSATEAPPAPSGLTLELIIIIAVVAVVLLVLIITIVIVCMRKRAVAFREPDSDPLEEGLYDIPHANM